MDIQADSAGSPTTDLGDDGLGTCVPAWAVLVILLSSPSRLVHSRSLLGGNLFSTGPSKGKNHFLLNFIKNHKMKYFSGEIKHNSGVY